MSRSNPTEHAVHPCKRWFEWHGSDALPYWYDKESKSRVFEKLPFTFLLLDTLAVITGWHDASDSGITSNEVRDTRTDIMTVRSFKGGELASGLYQDIKDRVKSVGGEFTSNLYIATKIEGDLALCSLKLHGAALKPWMDFSRENRADLYSSAIAIVGSTEGKKGKIVYQMPTFKLKSVSQETDEEARELDKVLQGYLKGYLARAATVQPAEAQEPQRPSINPDAPEHWREPDGSEGGYAPAPGGPDAGEDGIAIDEDEEIPF